MAHSGACTPTLIAWSNTLFCPNLYFKNPAWLATPEFGESQLDLHFFERQVPEGSPPWGSVPGTTVAVVPGPHHFCSRPRPPLPFPLP